mmetsp:Transcript_1110/g.3541  ORF Transcript_1110/g.3541 Transcript_1110/m.3541 type:complete len:202 (+) Transcript_1110:750-1355(+)
MWDSLIYRYPVRISSERASERAIERAKKIIHVDIHRARLHKQPCPLTAAVVVSAIEHDIDIVIQTNDACASVIHRGVASPTRRDVDPDDARAARARALRHLVHARPRRVRAPIIRRVRAHEWYIFREIFRGERERARRRRESRHVARHTGSGVNHRLQRRGFNVCARRHRHERAERKGWRGAPRTRASRRRRGRSRRGVSR